MKSKRYHCKEWDTCYNLRTSHSHHNASLKYGRDMLEVGVSSEEGMSDEESDRLLEVKYHQLDLLEENLMCVIKAASSGICRHESNIAEGIMQQREQNIDCSKMNDARDFLIPVHYGVQSEYMRKDGGLHGIFSPDILGRTVLG